MRNRTEVSPFATLISIQERLCEQKRHLEAENSSLSASNDSLVRDKLQLEAALQTKAGVAAAADSINVQELQLKMFNLQEELTEMHRLKVKETMDYLWMFCVYWIRDEVVVGVHFTLYIQKVEIGVEVLPQV